MGASSSTQQSPSEQQELESLAASTGALPILHKAFSKLADPQTKSIPLKTLQEHLSLNFMNAQNEGASSTHKCFLKVLPNLGPAIVELFFTVDKEGIDWIEFLRGYSKCGGRMPASMSLHTLCREYAAASEKAGHPLKLEFEYYDDDCKISGAFTPADLLMLLWMCWVMSQATKPFSKWQDKLCLPDTSHLILSAITSCIENCDNLNIWNYNISDLEVQLPAQKLHTWILRTVPGLAYCFSQYLHARLQCASSEDNLDFSNLSLEFNPSTESHDMHMLTCGRAWAISLTLTSTLSEEILNASVPRADNGAYDNLLYRSSLHGKGLNRFWSKVEGYNGPLLILVSASSRDSPADDSSVGRWIFGVLTQQGFENKDVFYGSSGYLYAINPVFHVFSPSGKEKNFVYSHLHPSSRVYQRHPKPVGIAFGGTIGNERIFIDEDFARVTVRHHAVDKTYQPGSLLPNQGFLPIEASILEVEVWGLGGEKSKQVQNKYKKREEVFTEQRRRVDLKTFASWEDSPEKMMMDMISDPNIVRREDR